MSLLSEVKNPLLLPAVLQDFIEAFKGIEYLSYFQLLAKEKKIVWIFCQEAKSNKYMKKGESPGMLEYNSFPNHLKSRNHSKILTYKGKAKMH